ncbi:hypothetical protein [Methylomonas fluvii]|nr:hypothetical protein [Methylomonas fluvii]
MCFSGQNRFFLFIVRRRCAGMVQQKFGKNTPLDVRRGRQGLSSIERG